MIWLSWRAGCPSGSRPAGGSVGGLVQATGQQWCRHRVARQQGQCPGKHSSGHLAWTGSQRQAGVYKGAWVGASQGSIVSGGGRGWKGTPGSYSRLCLKQASLLGPSVSPSTPGQAGAWLPITAWSAWQHLHLAS